MAVFLFDFFEVYSFRRFVLQINIVKVGKINIHFANVVEKLGSVQGSFRLKIRKNVTLQALLVDVYSMKNLVTSPFSKIRTLVIDPKGENF